MTSVLRETHEPIQLITTADSQSWRERINKEVDTAHRLKGMLDKAELRRTLVAKAPMPPMPVPPTTFAAMHAKLSTPGARKPCATDTLATAPCAHHPRARAPTDHRPTSLVLPNCSVPSATPPVARLYSSLQSTATTAAWPPYGSWV